MTDTKRWFESKALWGSFVSIVGIALALDSTTTGLIVTAIGNILAIYGRLKAKATIQ